MAIAMFSLEADGSDSDNPGWVQMLLQSDGGPPKRANDNDIDPFGTSQVALNDATGRVSVLLEYLEDSGGQESNGVVSSPIYITYDCQPSPVVEGLIEGRVSEGSVDGAGVSGARISVVQTGESCGGGQPGSPDGGSAASVENGDYLIDGLRVGCYEATIAPPDGYVVSGDSTKSGLVLSADDLRATADFVVTRQPSPVVEGLIEGRVSEGSVDGAGVSGARISVVQTGESCGGGQPGSPDGGSAASVENGDYLIDGLRVGCYEATIAPPDGYVVSGDSTKSGLVLSADDLRATADFVVTRQPSPVVEGLIEGRVSEGSVDGAGVSGARISVVQTGESCGGGQPGSPDGGSAASVENGDYLIDGLRVGCYEATIAPPDGYVVSGDSTKSGLVLSADDLRATADFVVTRQPSPVVEGLIEGRVSEGSVDGAGVSGARISVVQTGESCGGGQPGSPDGGSAASVENGDYLIDGLRVGCYEATIAPPDGYVVSGDSTKSGLVLSADDLRATADFVVTRQPSTTTPTKSAAILIEVIHDQNEDGDGEVRFARSLSVSISPCDGGGEPTSKDIIGRDRFVDLAFGTCWQVQLNQIQLDELDLKLVKTDCMLSNGRSVPLSVDSQTPERYCEIVVQGGTIESVPTGNSLPSPPSRAPVKMVFGLASLLGSLIAASFTALQVRVAVRR